MKKQKKGDSMLPNTGRPTPLKQRMSIISKHILCSLLTTNIKSDKSKTIYVKSACINFILLID